MKKYITPQRVALVTGLVLSVIAFLTSLETSFVAGSPAAEAIAKGIVMLGAVAKAGSLLYKFIEGGSNFDLAQIEKEVIALEKAKVPVS